MNIFLNKENRFGFLNSHFICISFLHEYRTLGLVMLTKMIEIVKEVCIGG